MGCASLLGVALGLGGAGVQELANAKTKSEMNDVMNQQLVTQNKLRQQGQGVFNSSLRQSTPDAAKQQIQIGADKFRSAAQNAQAVPLGLANPALTTADQSANAARAGLGNTAMANYAGYGQYGQEQSLKDRAANSQLGVINQQSQQALSFLPAELQGAHNDYNSLRGVGSLLGTAGSLVGLGGSLGMFGGSPVALTPLNQLGKYPGTSRMLAGIGQNAQQGNWLTGQGLYGFGGGGVF